MRFRLSVLAAMLFFCVGAYADTYRYAFTFSNFQGINNVPTFTITFDEPNLINKTGTEDLPALNLPLGFTANFFGSNIYGVFAFAPYPPRISDQALYYDNSILAFSPDVYATHYLGVGTYHGTTDGNVREMSSFLSDASLTITDLDAVPPPPPPPPAAATPEPSSLVLLGTGTLGVAGTVRRRFARKD